MSRSLGKLLKNVGCWIVLGLGIFPFVCNSPYLVYVFCLIGIYSMVALGLSLLLGYAGQISLGHAGFFCIGAYCSAIIATKTDLNLWIGVLIAAFIASLTAYIISFPILRLQGYFLALATLGFGEIVEVLVNENSWLTKGPFGITQIPSLSFGGFVFDNYEKFYYLIWLVLGLMFVFSKNVVDSREGRAMKAISVNELVASTLGINTARFKVKVFVLSAAFAGIAGSFYSFFMTAISPSDFTINLSLLVIMMVIIGGMGDLAGAVLGAIVLTAISEALSNYKEYSLSLYGLLLVVLLIFMPEGIYVGLKILIRRCFALASKLPTIANR